MLFRDACSVFEKMEATAKRLELASMLASLFVDAKDEVEKLVFLVQGKLAPDYEGIETGMADKLLVKALSGISNVREDQILKDMAKTGDLGTVAFGIASGIKQRALEERMHTIADVFDSLKAISKISGEGSISKKLGLYTELIIGSTPSEAKYITRIITGRLRLGVSDATIISSLIAAFGWDGDPEAIEYAYNCYPDMARLARLMRSHDWHSIAATSPAPMVPVKVMLAERLTSLSEILVKLGKKAAFEYKYDGLRTQIHYDGSNVKIFSRGSEETTGNFPDIIRAFKSTFNLKSCILDGESVPYNPETGELYPFQMVSKRRGRKYDLEGKSEEIPIVVFLFDILYLDGRSTMNLPYEERRKLLESLFSENENFKLATRIVSSDLQEIQAFFEKSIADGCEGIVAKSVSDETPYRAGARGWQWIKFKRDYQRQMGDSLDLVVLGAFAGHGRRKGTYGALLMGVYNDERDTFETICKLGTGFNYEILFSLPKRFEALKTESCPNNVNSIMTPEVWFYPDTVLEVVGAEITISPVHTCAYSVIEEKSGLSLRFPRFTGIFRTDKKGSECSKTSEIISMYNNQAKK